jgi:hypothetical protein
VRSLGSRILAAEKVRGIAPPHGNGNNCNSRVGIDDWNGRLEFVLTLQNNDRQDVTVRIFRSGSEPTPEPWNALPISANSRMRFWARGRDRWRHDDAIPALYYWLTDCWESELRAAGYTFAIIPEIQHLRAEGLAYLLERMRFRTHECWKNHELRLGGFGMFEPWEHDVANLPPEERAEAYRKECGLPCRALSAPSRS